MGGTILVAEPSLGEQVRENVTSAVESVRFPRGPFDASIERRRGDDAGTTERRYR